MAVEVVRIIPYPAEAVWRIVGDPGRVDWVPGVVSCEFDGEVRRFTMSGAGGLAERIILRDPAARTLIYSVIESTPPLHSHRASLSLEPVSSGTRIVWQTAVEPVAVEPFIEKRMAQSLDQLEQILLSESA